MLTSQTDVCGTIKHKSPVSNGVEVEVEVPSVIDVAVMVDVVIVVVGGNRLDAVDVDAGRKTAVKQVVLTTVVSLTRCCCAG